MEARACHTPFITTDLGALKETGGSAGWYIHADPHSKEYLDEFIEMVNYIIISRSYYLRLQKCCYPIRTYNDYSEDLLTEIDRIKSEIL
jgi:hypothetical protein